ncbi:MAG: PAS domain S-box protein [Planctomycetia bacterium]|nr:PAS domain S-box protein [Planctomycetia bacterium]
MQGSRSIVLPGALATVLAGLAALDGLHLHAGFAVPLAAAALLLGAAAGAAWQARATEQLAHENIRLREETERQRRELEHVQAISQAQQSEAEVALRDSEALYHSLVDHLSLSVLRKDRSGKYTFVNRRFLEFSGKQASEVIGITDFDLFPPELAAKYRAGDEQVMSTGSQFEDVESYQKSAGEKRYIQVLKTPIRDAGGAVIGTQVMFWDVTDKHNSEEAFTRFTRELEQRNAALVESEQNLQRQTDILKLVLNSISDGVVVADRQGKFLIWNPAAESIIGLGALEKPAEAWSEAYGLFELDRTTPFPSEQLPLTRAIHGEFVAAVEMFIRNEMRPQGVVISVSGAPLREAGGEIRGGVVVFRDVTRERAAQVALRESEERARQIVETAYDPFISIDSRGHVVDWNSRAQQVFGYTREEAQGRLLADLILPTQYREAHTQGIHRYFETGEGPVLNTRIEITALNRDGREFPVELTIWPLQTANGCFFHAFIHDITRRKQAEHEIQSKNQDLETLLYVTSHDLREPLRAIENFSRLVSERYADKLDAKGQDFLQRVVRGAQRLDRLIEDVLQLSRAQRSVQASEDVDSGEIVADVIKHLEPRIRETGASVRVAEPLPGIRADRRWATQAIQNLVSNALKYTVEGQAPDVEIGEFRGPEGVGLAVRDRGMGVPPDCAERIFQLFQRAVSRNIEGTGAGLAIVKRVAERHGGRAWVRPREGGGSEFIITFGSGTAV